MDYDNYTVGGDVTATLNLEKIEINAYFNITYTDAERLSLNSTHITVSKYYIMYVVYISLVGIPLHECY